MKRADFSKAAEFWSERETERKKMPKEKCRERFEEYVSNKHVCALGTGFDDFVRCTPLEYKYKDGIVYIVTEGGFKFRGLSENKRVSMAVFDQDVDMNNLKSVQVYGYADVYDNTEPEFAEGIGKIGYKMEAFQNLEHPMYMLQIKPIDADMLFSSFKEEGYDAKQHIELN